MVFSKVASLKKKRNDSLLHNTPDTEIWDMNKSLLKRENSNVSQMEESKDNEEVKKSNSSQSQANLFFLLAHQNRIYIRFPTIERGRNSTHPWMGEPGRLQSMGSLGVGYNWATSLSLFTFMHWRRKWQPTPVFLPGESRGRGSLVGCRLWDRIAVAMDPGR